MVRRAGWLRTFERLIEERAEQLLYGVALLLRRARPMAAIAVSAMALKVLNHSASRGETHLPRSVWRRAAGVPRREGVDDRGAGDGGGRPREPHQGSRVN